MYIFFSEIKQLYFVIYKLKCTNNFLMGPKAPIKFVGTEIIPVRSFCRGYVESFFRVFFLKFLVNFCSTY